MANLTHSEQGSSYQLPNSAHFLLNDKCNARCVFCGGNYYNSRSGRMLTLEKFKIIAKNIHLEHFRQAVLAGAGDPLLCPDFVPIMEYLHATYPSVGISVTTNGIAMNRELCEAMLACGVTMLNISLNAATRETYQRLMQVDAFDRICRQLKDFSALCWERGQGPHLQLSIPIMRCNVEELPLLIQFAHEVGAVAVNVFYCRFYPREIRNDKDGGFLPDKESLFFYQELSDRIVVESEQLAQQLGVQLLHEPLFSQGDVPKCCSWTENELMIGFDGEVFPCGGGELHFKKKLERGEYDFGNALQQTIEEFWNNDSYRDIRVSSKREGACVIPECGECSNMTSHMEQRGHILEWADFSDNNQPDGSDAISTAPPLISIIVPTHNRPDMLKDAIQSILDQTLQDFEIVIVNDAGQDVSDVVQSFNSSKLVYLSHETNKGLAAARNTGISAAKGKYIAYLDDDDIFYPEHLETLVTFLRESGENVAYTDAFRAHQHLQGDRYVTYYKDIPYSHDFDNDRILYKNFVPVLCFMHEKGCFERCGMFDESFTRLEDWELWLRMSRQFTMHHIRSLTCEFRYRPDGSSMVSGSMARFLDMTQQLFQKHPIKSDTSIEGKRQQHLSALRCDTDKQLLEAMKTVGVVTTDEFLASSAYEELFRSGASREVILSSWYHHLARRQDDSGFREQLLATSLEIDPGNYAARSTLCSLLVNLNRLDELVPHLEKLLRASPEDKILRQLATSLERVCALKFNPSSGDRTTPKPITMAVFSLDLQEQACTQLRFYGVRGAFAEQMDILWGNYFDRMSGQFTTFAERAELADIIVLARFFPRKETASIIERLFALGKPVVYDVDDLLTALPVGSPFKQQGDESAPFIVDVARRAARVTVSTKPLQQEMLAYNLNVTILPNLLDQTLWGGTLPVQQAEKPIVIGYAGGFTHTDDLQIIEDALLAIAEKFGKRVTFRFMGCVTDRLRALPTSEYIEPSPNYGTYALKLRHAGLDIALAPLVDNRFNRCKSNIKWLEYSACGFAGIYSDLPPYNACISNGISGLLVENTTEQWVAALEQLITDTELRHSIAGNARSDVLAHYTLDAGAQQYLDCYHSLLGDSSTAPRCSIIIPVYNRLVFTRQCLEVLLADPFASRQEIIVVDNGSRDATPVYLQGLVGQIRVVNNGQNLGFAKACNVGAKAAAGSYLVFLNNDTIPQPGWLEALIDGAEQQKAAIVGAKLLYPNGTIQHAGVAFGREMGPYHIFSGFAAEDPAVTKIRPMQAVTAACMLVERELFLELGGFDEGYLNGFEDLDFCLRAAQAGHRICYIPESVVIHFESISDGRKQHDAANLARFRERWDMHVRYDDEDIYRSEGITLRHEPDGRIFIERKQPS